MADKYVQLHPLNETKTALDESVKAFPYIGPNSFKGFDPEAATEPNVFKPQEKLVSGENIKALAFSEKQPAASLLGNGILNLPLLDLLYPVGSIYMCAEDKFDGVCPIQQLLGGTWVRIKDKFMYAAGDNDELGATGGSKDAVVVSHSHESLPAGSHSHNMVEYTITSYPYLAGWYASGYTNRPFSDDDFNKVKNAYPESVTVERVNLTGQFVMSEALKSASGDNNVPCIKISTSHKHTVQTVGDHTHNIATYGVDGTGKNMPPYLVVYMWKRVENVESEEE